MVAMASRSVDRSRTAARENKAARSSVRLRSKYSATEIQKVVSTLQLATSPTRLAILILLSKQPRFAGEIREELGNPSQPSVSHQLSLLRHGKLVESHRDGRKILYRLTDVGRLLVDSFGRIES